MDKFVEKVFIVSDKYQKKIDISWKIKRHKELSQLLFKQDENDFQNQSNTKVDVPDEFWLKIMKFLSYKDLFNNLSLVNKHFNNLTHDSSVIKSIDLMQIYSDIKLQSKMHFLKRSRNINHVNVTKLKNLTNTYSAWTCLSI